MFICTTVLYEYMKSLRNEMNNLFDNTHVGIKIYQEFYHSIIYIANEGRHVRIFIFYGRFTKLVLRNQSRMIYYNDTKLLVTDYVIYV